MGKQHTVAQSLLTWHVSAAGGQKLAGAHTEPTSSTALQQPVAHSSPLVQVAAHRTSVPSVTQREPSQQGAASLQSSSPARRQSASAPAPPAPPGEPPAPPAEA